jgi:hypothetical protein
MGKFIRVGTAHPKPWLENLEIRQRYHWLTNPNWRPVDEKMNEIYQKIREELNNREE